MPWGCGSCSGRSIASMTRTNEMDDADRATENEEAAWADLERRIAASRGHEPRPTRSHCQDCGEPLEVHRLSYGLCLACAERAETRQRLWGHA